MINRLKKVRKSILPLLSLLAALITADAAAPVISSDASDSAVVGDPYLYTITSSTDPALIYSVVGTLPAGLSHAGGVIDGTPTEDGVFDLVLTATNADGASAPFDFTLTVTQPIPEITSSLVETARVGDPYTYTIEADNSPTSYALLGSVPGLTFDSVNGILSGTPTSNGSFGLLISAINGAGQDDEVLNLTVEPALDAAPVVISSATESAFVGDAYTYEIVATNSPTGYSIIGDLPDGLSLSGSTISGTLTTAEVTSFTIAATNAFGVGQLEVDLTVTYDDPVITSSLAPTGRVGDPFSYQLTGTNVPTSFSITGLSAIGGLTFDPSTGLVSGTPLTAGVFDLVLTVSNGTGSDEEVATLTIDPSLSAEPTITSPLTDTAFAGSFYSYTIVATNSPTNFGLIGSLPAGLSRSGATISGVPTDTGVFNITLVASNDSGSGQEVLVLTVLDAVPAVDSPTRAFATVDEPFTYMITATNAPTSYGVVGLDSIAGLSFDPSTGVISGTPTVEGDFDLLVSATNGSGTDVAAVNLLVGPATDPTGNTPPTVVITSPVTAQVFDGETLEVTVEADVTPSSGGTVDTVFVRWLNPPDNANSTEIILATLSPGATSGSTTSFTGTIAVGYNPNNRELGAGDLELEVVAFEEDAVNAQDFGSDTVDIHIDPLVQFNFPSEDFTTGAIPLGELFTSVVINTNDFVSATARISGTGLVDTVGYDDDSNNLNGVFNFLASKRIDFPGDYSIEVTVLDGAGNTTVIERTFTLSESLGSPVAAIKVPTPGFRNQVFAPALIKMLETDSTFEIARNGDGDITEYVTTREYSLELISGGQGYFPRDKSDVQMRGIGSVTADAPLGSNVGFEGLEFEDGRLVSVPDTMTYTFRSPVSSWDGYGDSFQVALDSPADPGLYSRVDIAAEFFKSSAELESFRLYVNGEDVTPGAGNLNPAHGGVDVPLIAYPAVGSPLPGDYVVVATVVDREGNVAVSPPLSFSIVGFEPIDVELARVGDTVISQGDSVTFQIAVDPIGEIETVELFDADTNDSLGFAAKITVDGAAVYRFTQNYDQQGEFGIYAVVTAFDDRVVQSNALRFDVEAVDDLEVNITVPDSDRSLVVGQSLSFEAIATATPGVESLTWIVNNSVEEVDTSEPYQFTRVFNQVGIYTVRVSAIDNFENSAGAPEEITVTVLPSDVEVSITSTLTDTTVIAGDTHVFSATTVASLGVASVEWYVNDVLVETATTAPYDFTYTFPSAGTASIRAEATDTLGNSASDTLVLTVNLSNPLVRDNDFVNYVYTQFTGAAPTSQQLEDALVGLDGSLDARVALLEDLMSSAAFGQTRELVMIYRTMLGRWPNASEIALAREGLFGATAGASTQSGNILPTATQTFNFNFTAGDNVTVRVTGDASNGNPLTDPTLTINDPSGNFVAFSDDSFFSLNPLINFTPSVSGTYTAIVAGFSSTQQGDFTISTSSSNGGGSSVGSNTALVTSLRPEFQTQYGYEFPLFAIGSASTSNELLRQLFRNKHGSNPSAWNESRLKKMLTEVIDSSSNSDGFAGDAVAFAAAFALDNRTGRFSGPDGGKLTTELGYELVNNPSNKLNAALIVAILLAEEPTDELVNSYSGQSLSVALESILTDSRYFEQFPPANVMSYVAMRLAEEGAFDLTDNGPDDDYDGDGYSNIYELAFGSNPADAGDVVAPMAAAVDGDDFVLQFVRIKDDEVPGDFIIYIECSPNLVDWDMRSDTAEVTSLAADQAGVPEGYERVELRVDMTERECDFFRLSIELP